MSGIHILPIHFYYYILVFKLPVYHKGKHDSDCLQESHSQHYTVHLQGKVYCYLPKEENPRDSHLFKFIVNKIFEGRDFMNGHDLIVSSELPIKGGERIVIVKILTWKNLEVNSLHLGVCYWWPL